MKGPRQSSLLGISIRYSSALSLVGESASVTFCSALRTSSF